MSEGKRKAGFFAKLAGTMGYGLLLATAAYFYLGESFLGVQKPPFATFLLIGLAWPAVWGVFWGIRVVTPMPFELLPILFECVLVGPGHLAAWIVFGKRQTEDEAKAAPSTEAAAPAPASPEPPPSAPPTT